MSRGGARPGAGRKTNAEIARIRELIDSVISDDDWKKVLANLLDIATTNKGYAAVQAAQLLCRYRFGVPVEQDPEPERDIVPIQYIEVDPLPNVRDDYDLAEDSPSAEGAGFAEDSSSVEGAGFAEDAPSSQRRPVENDAATPGSPPETRPSAVSAAPKAPAPAAPKLSAEKAERRKRRAHRLHMRHLARL